MFFKSLFPKSIASLFLGGALFLGVADNASADEDTCSENEKQNLPKISVSMPCDKGQQLTIAIMPKKERVLVGCWPVKESPSEEYKKVPPYKNIPENGLAQCYTITGHNGKVYYQRQ